MRIIGGIRRGAKLLNVKAFSSNRWSTCKEAIFNLLDGGTSLRL